MSYVVEKYLRLLFYVHELINNYFFVFKTKKSLSKKCADFIVFLF